MGLKPPIDQAGTKFDHHGRPSLTHRSEFDLASFLTRAGGYRIHVFFCYLTMPSPIIKLLGFRIFGSLTILVVVIASF